MEQDPSGYDDGGNLYQMEGDDPTDLTDPQGLWKVSRNGAAKADAVSENGDTSRSWRRRSVWNLPNFKDGLRHQPPA